MKKTSLWQLFITFFKTGLFTFGGGYAMISILEEELVTRKKWITSQDMLDMIMIAESTPGVIAVNTATGVGFRLRGVLGSFIATLGVVLPSFLLITGLSFAIEAIAGNFWYKAAFTGIQACVTILIINAFIKMAGQISKDWFNVVLVIAAFGVASFTGFNAIFLILIGGVLGICFNLIKDFIKSKKTRAETDSASAEEVCKTQAEEKAEIFDEKSNAEVDETSAIDVKTSKDDQDGEENR